MSHIARQVQWINILDGVRNARHMQGRRFLKGVYLTAAEIEAMHGTGPLSTCAYLWLRSWADIRTGAVGQTRPISLGMLRAYCETHVSKGAGVQLVQPSERNIRTALAGLERAGLLRRLSGDRLCYRLLLAQTLPHAHSKPDADLTGQTAAKPDGVDNSPDAWPGAASDSSISVNATRYSPRAGRSYLTHIRDQRIKPSPDPAASLAMEVQNVAPATAGRKGRHAAIAALFREQGVVVGPGHPVIADLAAINVSDADLLAAVELARQAREAEGTGQPLNPGFIRAKLRKAIEQKKPTTVAWWSSVPTMEAQARRLNIPGARPGESLDEFKARIWSAARQDAVSIA
jgi:hypothetical protein